MFGYDWEFISVLLVIAGSVWGAIAAFSNWRSAVAVSKQNIKTLTEKVAELEKDMKTLTLANQKMSDSFHNDIKSLLIAFRGKAGE